MEDLGKNSNTNGISLGVYNCIRLQRVNIRSDLQLSALSSSDVKDSDKINGGQAYRRKEVTQRAGRCTQNDR